MCGGLLCSGTPVGPSRATLAVWLSGLEVRCGGGREITFGVRVDKDFLGWLVSSARGGIVPKGVLV